MLQKQTKITIFGPFFTKNNKKSIFFFFFFFFFFWGGGGSKNDSNRANNAAEINLQYPVIGGVIKLRIFFISYKKSVLYLHIGKFWMSTN